MSINVGTTPTIPHELSIPRWATVIFVIAAALQTIDGVSGFPSVPAVLLAGLSAAAIYFIATRNVRYALYANAAALLTVWLRMMASVQPEASPTDILLLVVPMIAITVAVLAWRKRLPTFAALLSSLPTLLSIALAFFVGLVAS